MAWPPPLPVTCFVPPSAPRLQPVAEVLSLFFLAEHPPPWATWFPSLGVSDGEADERDRLQPSELELHPCPARSPCQPGGLGRGVVRWPGLDLHVTCAAPGKRCSRWSRARPLFLTEGPCPVSWSKGAESSVLPACSQSLLGMVTLASAFLSTLRTFPLHSELGAGPYALFSRSPIEWTLTG